MFGKRTKAKTTVFVTQRREIHAMAQAILRDNGVSFAVREEVPSPQDGEEGEFFEIGVDAGDFARAYKLLRSLVEFDAALCGR